jgi:hypothetical protein
MKKISAIVATIVCFLNINAQVEVIRRIEFDVKEGFSGYNLHLFGKDGFVIRSYGGSTKGYKDIKYELYDTDLNLKKEHLDNINVSKVTKIKSFETKTHFLELYYEKSGATTIVSVEGKTLKTNTVKLNLPAQLISLSGEASDDYLFLVARIKKSVVIYIIDWHNGDAKLIPITIGAYKGTQLSVVDISVLSNGYEAFFSIKGVKGKKSTDMYLMLVNAKEGSKTQEHISGSLEKNIVSISAKHVAKNKYILTGTYSSKAVSSSEGIYFAQYNGKSIEFIKYKSFVNLDNFLSYLPQKKQDKIEKKKSKKEASGRELTIDYLIAGHDLIVEGDHYYYLGEAYYPTYRTETYTTYVNGKPVTQTRQVFDGYQYTHATLVKYNAKGEIIWDQTFEMWPSYKPFSVKRFIKVGEDTQKTIDMVFTSRSRIFSKSFDHKGNVVEDRKSEELKSGIDGDVSKFTNSNVASWYDKMFVSYGTQAIKNKENDDVKKKRTVFFVSKIKF